jgi:hypothetical protein
MKLFKCLLAVAALTIALTLSAKADLVFLTAVDFNNGPNSPDNNHTVLVNFLGFDPGPLSNNFENGSVLSGPVTVTPGEFFVVHYGKGKGGTGSGGSWEIFQVQNNETTVTFPQLGNGPTNNPDPFGHGGISSARGFGGPPTTPDSGTTAALLGLSMASLAGLRARFGRK